MWGKLVTSLVLILSAAEAAGVSIYQIEVPASDYRAKRPNEISPSAQLACVDQTQCLFFTGQKVGKAFRHGERRSLLTNLHVLSDYLKGYWSLSESLDDIPVYLVVNGRQEWATVNVSEDAKNAILDNSLKRRPDLDRAQLTLTRDPVGPLESDGIRENLITPFSQGILETVFSKEGLSAIQFGDYTCVDSTSGTPVLNDKNEVVGMHTGQLDAGPAGTACYFVRF